MKKFLTVLKFELSNYIQNKVYMLITVLLTVVLAVVMFLPSIFDMSELLGTEPKTKTEESADAKDDEEEPSEEDIATYVIYDKENVFAGDLTALETTFADSEWKTADSADEVKKMVETQEADGGFVVKNTLTYEYFVYNKDLTDMDTFMFDEVLAQNYRVLYCAENNLNLEEVMSLINVQIDSNEQILGKDMSDSFAYCYILVIVVFMLIVFYCVMIATSVTSEKSNRSIEVLVTSTTPNSLIFGKVIAGVVASFVQVALVLIVALGGYALNRESWGNKLDAILDIPANVLAVFAVFAIFGFAFYAFIYAAIGALCSKTEDLNKSSSGAQMIIMIVYFVVLMQMSNIDGTAMKVLSFLPVSSYSAMYIRVAMGEVALWEIIVSFLILLASTGVVGYIAAKIYRMGTLRYGNPISIRSALKSLKDKSAE